MDISCQDLQGFTVVTPLGRLGFDEASSAQEQLEQAISSASKAVICDCSGLDYISSAGLRAFLVAAKAAERDGIAFVACNLNDNVQSVFTISGFDRIVPLHGSVDAAMSELSGA